MLRELNEVEMEMVSGGASPDDEIIVEGTFVAIDPDQRSIYIDISSGPHGGMGVYGQIGLGDGDSTPENRDTTVPDPALIERIFCVFGNNSGCRALRMDRHNQAGQPDPQSR